jgi:hypothetical protein
MATVGTGYAAQAGTIDEELLASEKSPTHSQSEGHIPVRDAMDRYQW